MRLTGRFLAGLMASSTIVISTSAAQARIEVVEDKHAEISPEIYRQHGFASATEMENYFAVDKVEVKQRPIIINTATNVEISEVGTPKTNGAKGTNPFDAILEVVKNPTDIGNWVKIGSAAWNLVVENRPVANVAAGRISVLPEAQTNWSQMQNWSAPVRTQHEVTATNLYGMKAIRLVYTVSYHYGGQFKGKGRYIADAKIYQNNVTVLPGYTLNSRVEAGQVVNLGGVDNPVPGVELQHIYTFDTIFKHMEGRDAYFIRGDGGKNQLPNRS